MPEKGAQKNLQTRLRVEDDAIVIAGREKGKRGQVMSIDRAKGMIVLQGINLVKRHQRPTQENPRGAIIEMERPIHISNVMYYDSRSKRGKRLGVTSSKEGKEKRRLVRSKGGAWELKDKAQKT